jgi:hypothetical protein
MDIIDDADLDLFGQELRSRPIEMPIHAVLVVVQPGCESCPDGAISPSGKTLNRWSGC